MTPLSHLCIENKNSFLPLWGFPDSSVGKDSNSNVGDPGLIPGSGRTAGQVIGYPLQFSWASLVAQLAKNLTAMQETWVQSLGWEDPLEKGKATHSSVLARRIAVFCVAKSQIRLSDFQFHFYFFFLMRIK